jgi:hypothetical protein
VTDAEQDHVRAAFAGKMLLHFRHTGHPWPLPEIAPAFPGIPR